MGVRGSLATAWVIVGAVGGCAAYPPQEGSSEEAPAKDQPLDITVDSLDIVHGALRISATMVDGAADVSVRLGGDCEPREVGGGLSTLSTLVWALGDGEIAEAIGCGLVVRARVRDGSSARYVNRVASLGVAVEIAPQESDSAGDSPRLQTVSASNLGVSVVFAPVDPGARLRTGDSILEAAAPESEEDPAGGDDTGRFTVPRIDFARCVLRGRALYLDGAFFAASLSVGGASVQAEPPEEPHEEG
jgi:hypothetical protein